MKSCLLILAVLTFAFVATVPANADNLYGSIRGTVTDPTGAVMAGVRLTAVNTATGISYTTTSNKDGLFAFPQVAIGDYTVKTEQSGFKKFQASGIHLDLNQIYNLDVKLQVGAISEELLVEANSVQVETSSMQQGTVMGGNQIVDIPLNGRDWTQLVQLAPGVVSGSDRFGTASLGNAYSTNGSESQQNSYLINGTDSNDSALNTPLVIPSPDAIGEFNLVTSTINPEFGRNSGSVVNAAIKNGTNSFHGSGFEFYRDTFLDAKAWFEPTAGVWHRNQFGGTIGGPIVKDHAFFFFSYQGDRTKEPEAGFPTNTPVYSQTLRNSLTTSNADFSVYAGSFSGNPIPFAMFGDSASSCPVSGGVMCQPGGATPPTYAQLFSTGMVPTQDLNQLALKLVNQFVPLPNAGNNFQFTPVTLGSTDQYIYRLDDKLTQNDALWFYSLYQTNPSQDTLPFTGATLPGFAEQAKRHYQQYTAPGPIPSRRLP